MADSASNPTITIIRNPGTPKESRQEGIPAYVQGNSLSINGVFNIHLSKYDEIHADFLDEPYIVTSIHSQKLPENRTVYHVKITPISIYRTTHVHTIRTAGKKYLPNDTLIEVKLGDFPGTVNITTQFPGQKRWSRFYNLLIHDNITEIPIKLVFLCHAKEDARKV